MTAPFAILAPARILFGRGQARAAAPSIAALGRRSFLVHGRDGQRAEWLISALTRAGVEVMAYACAAEPDLAMLGEAVAAARTAEFVVALGGGAVIDLGKAVAAMATAPGPVLEHLEIVGRGLPLTAAPLPFAALPTTAGTGAEVTKNAVIGVPEHRRKVSLRDDRMIADIAIVDPALTDGCPRTVTLASGLDAIVQVIEPYLCTRANAYTDALCQGAIPAGLAAIKTLMTQESTAARDQMAWVSLCGGLALANSGLGAVHALAGTIGGRTGAAHGAICGALLVHVLRHNRDRLAANTRAARRFDAVFGWIGEVFGNLDAMESWMHAAGLPRLSALGVMPGDHAAIAEASLAASSMKANPAHLDQAALQAVLAAAG